MVRLLVSEVETPQTRSLSVTVTSKLLGVFPTTMDGARDVNRPYNTTRNTKKAAVVVS